jgi:hypothetical protein
MNPKGSISRPLFRGTESGDVRFIRAMKPPISERSSLAQYPQVALLLERIVTVSQAGGMSDQESTALWNQVMGYLSEIDGSAFWTFRDEVIRLLVTPDHEFEGKSKKPQPPDDRWN